jgi:hypothetical protein
MIKKCSKCKRELNTTEFHYNKSGKYGVGHYCKKCANEEHRLRYLSSVEYRWKTRLANIKRNYGLSIEELNKKLENQNDCCAICNRPFNGSSNFCIDHNHKTMKIRGILCKSCNTLLGIIKDDVNNLIPVYKYLSNYKEKSLAELVKPKDDENKSK